MFDKSSLAFCFRFVSLFKSHQRQNRLKRAHIANPYILISHSFGGLNVQLYAATYPEEVQGLVLVDSSHEQQEKNFSSLILKGRAFSGFSPSILSAPKQFIFSLP